ncbi:helix-turn-helix transcriptional regulator [Listeria booriae]|uniref:helix-turn-helix domain-containing protein n=1 Tax=Listeria booriae TaxID=1552123 RepID=UPI001625645A|nr:helix-turn-helix transcriptional regulator [Listeria booriae]MBC2367798.1 helix-turn-helix transcriptional regulator [Listeria booriae]
MSSLGHNLKKLRLENKLTLENLASRLTKRSGLSFSKGLISRWENDIVQPRNEILKAYADEFNVSVDYLLGRIDWKSFDEDIDHDKLQQQIKDVENMDVNSPTYEAMMKEVDQINQDAKNDELDYIVNSGLMGPLVQYLGYKDLIDLIKIIDYIDYVKATHKEPVRRQRKTK